MANPIEMNLMTAQYDAAKTITKNLPKVADALERIALHLETIAVSSEALLDDHFEESQ